MGKDQLFQVLAILADERLISEAAHSDLLTSIHQDAIEDANDILQAVVFSLPQELQSKCWSILNAFGKDSTSNDRTQGEPFPSSSAQGRNATF